MEPPWVERIKVPLNDLGHMTKMATLLIYGKILQMPSSQGLVNEWASCIETWYVALKTQAYHSFFKL